MVLFFKKILRSRLISCEWIFMAILRHIPSRRIRLALIGQKCIVASEAVVTKDVPPYTVVGGIPAKKIGERNNHELCYSAYHPIHIV